MQAFPEALANNVNVRFSMKTNNVNDNVETKVRKTEAEVDRMASYLMDKLDAPAEYREWYCKVCWKLPEHIIMKNLDIAMRKGSVPAKYFTWLCNKSLKSVRSNDA